MTALWSEPEFASIAELVTSRTGLLFAPNRCESLEQAVRRVMRDHSLDDLAEFERRLLAGFVPWDALIAQMTVGETYFFRDREHFEFLSNRVLPELAERHGASYRPRVWSAGCASGEEAYSLAIALEEQGKLKGAFVLGTDLSRAALARARAARYKKWSLRGFDPVLIERHFRWSKDEVLLSPSVRDKVTFQELNLASSTYPSALTCTFAMDFILCRNVLIYLSAEVIAGVARRLFECLAPGGYLIVGPSDPLLPDAGFEIVSVPAGVAYHRPLAGFVAAAEQPVPVAPRLAKAVRSEPQPPRPAAVPAAAAETLPERAARAEGARDHEQLWALAREHPGEAWLAIAALRARSDALPSRVIEAECRKALSSHPLCAELHYLHGVLLLEVGRSAHALEALRRSIYLDSSLAIVHFTLGAALAHARDVSGAERSYRNAEQCARARPSDEPVPLAGELSASGLASAAARELSLLKARSGAR